MQQSPPDDAVRVSAESLACFLADLYRRVPIPDEHAELTAHLLVDTQMRGVYSHGVRQVQRYLDAYREGTLNTHPQTRVTNDGPATTALDGDGGLGIIVADEAIKTTIAKARSYGVAVATTTHHGHLGSSGKYVRQALREGMVAMCFAGRSLQFDDFYTSDDEVLATMGGAPAAAFGLPTREGFPDFLLDMAVSVFQDAEEMLERWPGIVFKTMGLSHMLNLMTGTLAGQSVAPPDMHDSQSGFYMVTDPEQFAGREAYMDQVDQVMQHVRGMKPLKGHDTAMMAGGPEHEHEAESRQRGVPIWGDDRESLEAMAARYDMPVPWAE